MADYLLDRPMLLYLLVALPTAALIVAALCSGNARHRREQEDMADACENFDAARTRHIIITVRRQQARRSSLDRHLKISEMVRPWRRQRDVDDDFDDLGISG